ncbi:MAG: glycosyltransferase family 2 protein [Candidatus Levybacteria bacterium]|nr:glycosyltransferase family 2 protein [Candidatus Levybacteria bacterium]
MSISIIIPNYNGQDLLKKNLPKVLDVVGDAEVIIVDDASRDRSLEILNNFKPKIKILKNENNSGFSSTINKGVREAKGEIVVLLNTDVVPEKDFLTSLLGHFNDEKIFAVGCMDKSIEGDKIILRGRGLGAWKRGFFVHSRGEVDKPNTLWVNGGSGAFRKSIWEKLGGFNELYNPFYWEDIDLSYRALKSGYKILFEPKSVVVHEHEKGAIKNTYSDFEVKTIAYRNQFIFVWENATDYSLQFLHCLFLPYHLIKAILRFDLAFFMGFLKAFILLPQIVKSSLNYQKLFVKKDSELIRELSK